MDELLSIALATIRMSTPLIFGALGALLSERSGVLNICVEGLLLIGAFFGAAAALQFHSEWWGFFFAGVAGAVLAAFYTLFVLHAHANQVVAGMAINLIASGITPFLAKLWYESSLGTPALGYDDRFFWFPSIAAAVIFFALNAWYHHTPSGLWLRFAGEHPQALATAGVSVQKVRWSAVIGSGMLSGWGGAALSLQLSSSFVAEMTAGRGYVALAALILGKWHPVGTVLACLFFGLTDALQIRWHGEEMGIPVQIVQMMPYVVTLVVLAVWVGHSRGPLALGQTSQGEK